ncbi:putative RDD family membrane protein YckC [Agrobacterium larrymoorei]|uniref:RDD family membrane protein YckC n=1 Tax=Agrobacterium larrymoorei TaxID=160699 RepID=A0AAJ2ER72_9HYPH|nr:RDD family protein [Agrobacterium larrymoorei]MDR6100118.1 putative RDD family membrane protein YckC [Agrobacterium larrymoorei]
MTFIIALLCIIVLSLSGVLEESARATAITLLGFLLRTPYYMLSELIWNGRTLGKRIAGIRVVNVEGRRLTPHQIATRNLMKEVEIFTPVGLIFSEPPVWLTWITLFWLVTVVAVILSSNRRQRLGDLMAGTLVIENPRSVLLPDLAAAPSAIKASQAGFEFRPEHLDVYGSYELQTLEDLLRDPTTRLRDKQILEITQAIIKKIGYREGVTRGKELEFLNAFYIAQREHLETLRLFGKRRENKFHNVGKDTASP